MFKRTNELKRIAVLIETTKIRLQRAIVTRDASLENRMSVLLLTLHAQFYNVARGSINIDAELNSIEIVFNKDNTDGVVKTSQNKAA